MSNLLLFKISPHIVMEIFILHGSGRLAIFPDTNKTNKQKKQILKLVNITSHLAALNINIYIICPESQFPHKQQQAFLVSYIVVHDSNSLSASEWMLLVLFLNIAFSLKTKTLFVWCLILEVHIVMEIITQNIDQ